MANPFNHVMALTWRAISQEMVDVVGVDHVSIGTDQSATPGLLPAYDDFTRVIEAMLSGGFTPAEVAKIAGGNYMRIFAATAG